MIVSLNNLKSLVEGHLDKEIEKSVLLLEFWEWDKLEERWDYEFDFIEWVKA